MKKMLKARVKKPRGYIEEVMQGGKMLARVDITGAEGMLHTVCNVEYNHKLYFVDKISKCGLVGAYRWTEL